MNFFLSAIQKSNFYWALALNIVPSIFLNVSFQHHHVITADLLFTIRVSYSVICSYIVIIMKLYVNVLQNTVLQI